MFQVLKLSKQINSSKNSCLGLGSLTLPSFYRVREHVFPQCWEKGGRKHAHLHGQVPLLRVMPNEP